MEEIRHSSMFQLVLESLRDSVIQGVLKPGEVVSHDQLAARLGVSRMPVREAVRLLEGEGFVRIRRNVGIEVLPLSWEDFQETYMMRQALESLAGRLAAPNLDDETLRALGDLIEKMEILLLGEGPVEPSDALKVTQAFHNVIYLPCGRAKLLKAIDTLRNHSARYRSFVVSFRGRAHQLLEDHKEIYKACKTRDPAAVSDTLYWHFEHALELARVERDRLPEAAK